MLGRKKKKKKGGEEGNGKLSGELSQPLGNKFGRGETAVVTDPPAECSCTEGELSCKSPTGPVAAD